MNPNQKLPQHLHVIGICGVATSALAIAFKDRGVKVTGSDKGFYPPVSTELEKHGIAFYAGWHPEKMTENGKPDIIIVGTASGSQNPETLYAKENNIPMYSFAEAIGKFFVRDNSIVCVGTWGKTTTSTLLSYILDKAGLNPTYMFGGISLSHESSARLTESKWNILEGDEYKSSPTDNKAKFFYYKPTHLLLTAVSWDHADLYPTENDYFAAFHKLLPSVEDKGLIVACLDHSGVRKVLESYHGKLVTYSSNKDSNANYTYGSVIQTSEGLSLEISNAGQKWQIKSPMLGLFQAENITGCFAMAHTFCIEPEIIIKAISEFKGLKRRMEKRLDGDVTIIDDIAHSPEKARSALETLRAVYKGKIITVFEPNIGNRNRDSIAKYDNAFASTDILIIPRLTKLKVAEEEKDRPIEGQELANYISKTYSGVKYIDDDSMLVNYLRSNVEKGDVIAFLGSHGFRGMIEEAVEKLVNRN